MALKLDLKLISVKNAQNQLKLYDLLPALNNVYFSILQVIQSPLACNWNVPKQCQQKYATTRTTTEDLSPSEEPDLTQPVTKTTGQTLNASESWCSAFRYLRHITVKTRFVINYEEVNFYDYVPTLYNFFCSSQHFQAVIFPYVEGGTCNSMIMLLLSFLVVLTTSHYSSHTS